jgi:hypothetical protein
VQSGGLGGVLFRRDSREVGALFNDQATNPEFNNEATNPELRSVNVRGEGGY